MFWTNSPGLCGIGGGGGGGGSERQRRGWGVGDRMLHELVKHKAGVGKALKCNRAGSGKNKQTNGEEEEEGG